MSAPPTMSAGPLPPDENLSANILASIWAPFPITAFFMFARFYVRGVRRNIGADDWLMLIGWILYIAAIGMDTAVARLGGFRHIMYIPPDNVLLILKLEIITQPFGIFCLAFVKSSVAVLLPRLLGNTSTWRARFLYANVIVYFAITVVTCVLIFEQCDPPEAVWNPALKATGQAKCLDPSINLGLSALHGAFGAYLDFLLALFPVTIIAGLNLSLQKKLGLCTLLGLGVFAGICGVVKTVKLVAYQTATDPTWESYALNLWAGLEAPFVIIAGSAGPAKPLADNWFKGRSIEGRGKGKHGELLSSNQSFWGSLKSGLLFRGSRKSTFASSNPTGASHSEHRPKESGDGILMVRTVDVESQSIHTHDAGPARPYMVFGKP